MFVYKTYSIVMTPHMILAQSPKPVSDEKDSIISEGKKTLVGFTMTYTVSNCIFFYNLNCLLSSYKVYFF